MRNAPVRGGRAAAPMGVAAEVNSAAPAPLYRSERVMLAYILRRLLLLIPTLFGIMVLNFVIISAAPGGCFASASRGPRPTCSTRR